MLRRGGSNVIIRAILGITVLLFVATGRAFAQQEGHHEAIDNAYREWVEATNAKDLNRWASFLAPNPLFLPPNHPALHGELEIREFYARMFADSLFSLNCRQEQIEVATAKDMAWSTGICEATFTGPDGDPARGSSKWAKVWRRLPGGNWKCALNSWSANGLSGGGDSGPTGRPRPAQELGNEINAWIENEDLVGAELLIIRDGEVVVHEAYGWDDRQAGTQLQKGLIYSLASLTKPVTALMILMLVDDGILSLDDPVSRYVPGFAGDPRATVHDLLAQTSGDGGEHGDGAYNVYDFETLEGWVHDWAATEATAEYGEFRYSNFKYAALAYIAQHVSGVPFGELVTRRILEPLGMDDSYVAFAPDSSWAGRVATSYTWDEKTGRYELFWAPDEPQRWAFFPAAFGLWGTAEDYAKFVTLWFDYGVAEGRRLVSETLVRSALTPQGFQDGESVYGYGWFVDSVRTDDDLPLSFRHSGGRGTLAIGYPSDRGIVLYFTQSEIPPAHHRALSNRIEMSGIFHHPGPDMVWAATAGFAEASLDDVGQGDYEGLYRGTVDWLDGVDWEVRVWEADEVLQMSGGRRGSLLHQGAHLVLLGSDRFVLGRYLDGDLIGVDPPAQVRFLREAGQIAGLEVSIDGEVAFMKCAAYGRM
jgi:CubicO group peptidase (beta-lactamase class C family)